MNSCYNSDRLARNALCVLALFSVFFEIAVAAEISIDPSGFSPGQSYAKDVLSPDWLNAPGYIREHSIWTTAPSKYFVADLEKNYTLQSKGVSRDQEIETWGRVFLACLRLTDAGKCIAFEYHGEIPAGYFAVHIITGVPDGNFLKERRYTLFETSNLASLVPEYHYYPPPGTDSDRFTLGVEGFDIYAKFNGHEFLRFRDYRHMEEGRVALRAPQGYGFRKSTVRHRESLKPLLSDYANLVFDMRDFGLRPIKSTGSMLAGTSELTLNASAIPPFEVGDFVIVEIGGEAGEGKRGSLGVGGSWPSRPYANFSALQSENSLPLNSFAWLQETGDVYEWNGAEWFPVLQPYYFKKAIPLALKAKIIAISQDGTKLTLDKPAQVDTADATVHLDNAFILTKFGRNPDGDGENNWPFVKRSGPGAPESNFSDITPAGVTMRVPEGAFAIGEIVQCIRHDGWKLVGAGVERTRFFSPKGVPTASIRFYGSSGNVAKDFHFQGNLGDDGFCPRIGYIIPNNFGDPVTDTTIPQDAIPHGIVFEFCKDGLALDLSITDAWIRAVESMFSENIWAERVHIRRTQFLREYFSSWLFQFGDSIGGGAKDCSVYSPKITWGMQTFKSTGTQFIRCSLTNAYIACNSAGTFTLRDTSIAVEAFAGNSAARSFALVQIVTNIASSYGYERESVLIENLRITEAGFLDDANNTVGGIVFDSRNDTASVSNYFFSAPDYVLGSAGGGAQGLLAHATTFLTAENVIVSGTPRPSIYGNISIEAGVLRNCVADRIIVGKRASIETLQTGFLAGKQWNDEQARGRTVASLKSMPAFPNHPEQTEYLRIFEAPAHERHFYGEQLQALLKPPITGDYVFYLCAQLQAELYLSTNGNPGNARLIAREPTANLPREWVQGQNQQARGRPASNISAPIFLEAGREYFIEVLLKAYDTYNSHVEVTWRKPGDPEIANGASPIPGGYLSAAPAVGPISIYQAPVPRAVAAGTPVEFSVGVWGAPPHYFQWFANGTPIPDATRSVYKILATPIELNGTTYSVSVSNLLSGVVTTPVALSVNSSPILAAISAKATDELGELTFVASGTDSDSPLNELTFTLATEAPEGATIDPATGVFRWTPTEAQGPGQHPITLRVTDNGEPPLSAEQTFTVTVREVNAPPSLAVILGQTVDELRELTFAASSTDSDLPLNKLTLTLATGAPEGATIDPVTGVFRWVPAETQGPGQYPVTVRVTDNGELPLAAEQSFTVTIREVNTPPSVAVISEQSVDELAELTFTASHTDTDLPVNKLTFNLGTEAPEGATIDPVTGVFRWTPTEAQGPGRYPVTVRVTDDGEPPLSAEQTFTVTVSEVNIAPTLTAIPDQSAEAGRELTLKASVSDSDFPLNTLNFTLNPGAPENAALTPSGVFTWTPNEAHGGASYPITLTATDDGMPPLSDAKTFHVVVTAVQREIRITSASLAVDGQFTFTWSAQVGRSYQVQFKHDVAGTEWTNVDPPAAAAADSAAFSASVVDAPSRFFRVLLLPN